MALARTGKVGQFPIVRPGLVLGAGRLSAGELDCDRGAGVGVDFDRCAHRLDQPVGQGEAEACAFDLSQFSAESLKRLEQFRELVGRDADAGVGDRCADSSGCGDLKRDVSSSAGAVVLDRV